MIDIKNTRDNDLDLSGGDINYSESSGQHQQDILLADKGHYKEVPARGVGIINFLHETDPENLLRTVRKEFARDGMKVEKVTIQNGEIIASATYEDDNS